MSKSVLDPRLRVLLITPENRPFSQVEAATVAALRGGIRAVQLRDKQSSTRDLLRNALRLRALTQTFGALLLVNGRIDVAAACGADGVQLGAREIPPGAARSVLGNAALIGYSAHTTAECEVAREVDWITFSPVYPSPGKGLPVGMAGLGAAVKASLSPVIALGGVAEENIAFSFQAGAQGVSVIRAVYDAVNVQDAAARMVAAVQEWYGAKSGG